MGARASGWWDGTWNPVGGCKPISAGCKNCYAAKLAATQQTAHRVALYDGVTDWVRGRPVFNGRLTLRARHDTSWTWPLTWRGARHPLLGEGRPSLIFVGDMADLFIEGRPPSTIDKVVATIATSDHIGQLLTKRPERMAAFFTAPRPDATRRRWQRKLWLGISAERQQEFDERWPHMRALAEAGWTTFVSVAPMITSVRLPVDFLEHGRRAWCIASGEQNGERPMDPNWCRALRDQCADAGVPFFMLQMAGRKPIPVDLFIRQFPARPTPPRGESWAAHAPSHGRALAEGE